MFCKVILNGNARGSSPLMGSGMKSGFPEQRRCFCVNSSIPPKNSVLEPVASLRWIQFYLEPVSMHVFACWLQPPFLLRTNSCFWKKKVIALTFSFIWRNWKRGRDRRSTVFSRHFNTGSGCPWARVFLVIKGDLRASGLVLFWRTCWYFLFLLSFAFFFFACRINCRLRFPLSMGSEVHFWTTKKR